MSIIFVFVRVVIDLMVGILYFGLFIKIRKGKVMVVSN